MKSNQLRLALIAALGLVGVVSLTLYTGGSNPKTGIPDPIFIDGRTVEFGFTDDNSGEDLHIYTDKAEYVDGISHIEPIIAVVNQGVAQEIELSAYFSGTDRRVKTVYVAVQIPDDRYEPIMSERCGVQDVVMANGEYVATTTCVRVQTGTTTIPGTKFVWAPLEVIERDAVELAKENAVLQSVARKDVSGFEAKRKTIGYPVEPGQTVYFKVFIEFPKGVRDQVYFQAIGSEGGYGILK